MTLLGKIFTMLILVMSIVFMSFSVMVFATHRNWKEQAAKTDAQLQLVQQAKKDADVQLQQLKQDLRTEQAARTHAIAVLVARATRLETDLAAKTLELNQSAANLTEVAAQAKAAQTQLAALETEAKRIREDLRKTEQDLDTQALNVVKLTDDLNQATTLRDNEREKNTQAVMQISQMKMVLDANGLSEDSLVSHIPPKVEGVVLDVSTKDLIEISIGRDDGLKEGHSLEVYRGSNYLGRIVIRRTAPDRAVGQIIRELQRGQIKRGDRVSTKLS
jgi:septal ring factor EnvC (AmiA/AmiB activator)